MVDYRQRDALGSLEVLKTHPDLLLEVTKTTNTALVALLAGGGGGGGG